MKTSLHIEDPQVSLLEATLHARMGGEIWYDLTRVPRFVLPE
jgi:hypothetical protein